MAIGDNICFTNIHYFNDVSRLTHACAQVSIHTHTCTLFLYTLSIKDIGQDLEIMLLHSDRFGLVHDSSPFCWSFTTSCPWSTHQVLLIRSIHLSGDPPSLRLFLCGVHLRGCFWGRWSGIHYMLPCHFSCLSLSCAPPLVTHLSPSECQHFGTCSKG